MVKGVNDLVWEAIHTGKNAEPWVVHGAVSVGAVITTTNPTPSKVDVIGEVKYLPYVVPKNRVLVMLHTSTSVEYANDLTAHGKIRVTRPGVNDVIHIENEYLYGKTGYTHYTNAWYKEGSSLSVTLENTSGILFTIYFMLSGILVNVSEATKKV